MLAQNQYTETSQPVKGILRTRRNRLRTFFERGSRALVLVLIIVALRFSAFSQQEDWTWQDKDGNQRTRAELDGIIAKHQQYLASLKDTTPQSAAELVFLRANLSGANLSGARLSDAVLSGANLEKVSLKLANLDRAQLDNTMLRESDLGGASLFFANLTRADLAAADLTDANLFGANLTEASLSKTKLKGTDLAFANLKNAKFSPSENPPADDIAYAENLDSLRYEILPTPLLQLKKSLKDAGFWEAERRVNTAMRRHQSNPFELVFFDWTCGFGANPTRPLMIIFFVWLLCGLIYWVALHLKGRSGLYLIVKAKTKNHMVRFGLACFSRASSRLERLAEFGS